jgi:hypothetical protein
MSMPLAKAVNEVNVERNVALKGNVPPYVVEILVDRNEPMKAQGQQMFRCDAVFDWLVPAHRVFRHIGRDVRSPY